MSEFGPYRWANEEGTIIEDMGRGRFIPKDIRNRHYAGIIEYGHEILPFESPAAGGVFDSGPALEEIREAYEDSHTDNEGAGDVGLAEHTGADLGGDGGEHAEAGADVDPGEPADFSAEPVGDDSALDEPNSYPGMMIDHQHTETLLYNLREEPIKLVRDFYESRLTHELGDQDMRNALAFSDDPYRDEKLAWIAAMDAVLEQKLAEIAEMDGMALANYRGEAEGWPPVPVEEVEYEDDEPEGE